MGDVIEVRDDSGLGKMAECAVARCVQERRALRRELHKWGKDILLLVGFESIAEGLIGEEMWSSFSHYPIEEKSGYATDWTPENICCFCNLRKCPPPDPARGICPVDGIARDGAEDGDVNVDSDGHYCFGSCNPSLGSDQPLDLSVGSKSKAHTYWALMAERQAANADGACPSLLKVPQLPTHPGKLKRRLESLACKRSYTDDELQAALGDIRSGRLGTRRAAVIYGIPRSTLRNKVYKLALETGISVHAKQRGPSPSAVKAEAETESVPGLIAPAGARVAQKPEATRSVSESLRNLIRSRMVERAAVAAAAAGPRVTVAAPKTNTVANGNGWLRGLEPLLSRVLTNVQHFATQRNGREALETVGPRAALLPDLVRRLAEERFREELSRVTTEIHAPKLNTNTNNVILKIPSYKPTKNSCAAVGGGRPCAPKSSQVTLANEPMISRDVSRRVVKRHDDEDDDDYEDDCAEDDDEDNEREDDDDEDDDDDDEEDGSKGREATSGDARQRQASQRDLDRLDKRIRPKRGRYRNYDKSDLAEAVRAVRRGQMSVHRAGSYYGVPHSTLEYKVKERHLLRGRKRKRAGAVAESGLARKECEAASSCCSSNSSGSGSSSGAEAASAGASLWPSGQMLGVDVDLNPDHFFASQMMKKLQQDARSSQEQRKQRQSSYGARDTLLLSVLLRSGLAVQPKRSPVTATSSLTSPPPSLPRQSPARLGKNCSAQV